MENGYALALNKWALDKSIKNEVGLLIILSSLSAEKGYCYASNQYLANVFGTHEKTISRKLGKLEEKKYLKIHYEKKGFEITRREIRVTNLLPVQLQKCYPSSNKNVTYKNTSIKNTSNKNINNILPEWFDKKIISEKLSNEEKKEMEMLLKEFKSEKS